MRTAVTLHDLDADSLLADRALRHHSGTVSITLTDHTQLHFKSHADMIAFGEALAAMPIKRMVAA